MAIPFWSPARPVGAGGRTVTELLLKQGKAVRAMVRNEDERAQALRGMGAEVVVGNLLDLDSMHRVIAGNLFSRNLRNQCAVLIRAFRSLCSVEAKSARCASTITR